MLVNWTSNAILKAKGSTAEIKHSNSPLIKPLARANEGAQVNNFWMFFFVIIGLSLIPTSAIVFIIKERESNAKHQQFTAGVSLFSYWFSNFIWDFIKYLITASCAILLFYLWDIEEYFFTDHYQFQVVILIFLGFG